ncbi:MAG TPA: MoaD/ThiS family protein [Natrialbaceae archaeon]|nr:MoaD/ThiS family protein [Natrialbaceae archaeon]
MSTTDGTPGDEPATTVTVRATGNVRTRLGTNEIEFTFEGATLREFLDAFFDRYDVSDLLIAETEADAVAPGWVHAPKHLDDSWYRNPEGEQTRTFARVMVNGRFNETLGGFDTRLQDGDRITLAHPFMFCC